MKRTATQFGWKCDYETCDVHSPIVFKTPQDAAKMALINHSCHADHIRIRSNTEPHVGMAVGLNFHSTK